MITSIKILFLLFIACPVLAQLSVSPSSYTVTGVEGKDYVTVDNVKVSVSRIFSSSDTKKVITETDPDFGYVIKKEFSSAKLESKIIIEEVYTPCYRKSVLVGKWHEGQIITVEKIK